MRLLPPALSAAPDAPPRSVPPRVAYGSILGFGLFYFALTTFRAALVGYDAQVEMLGRRATVTLLGIGIVALFYLALRRFDRAVLRVRILAAILLAIPASALYATANFAIFYWYAPLDEVTLAGVSPANEALMLILDYTTAWYFFFAAWAALYLALGYAGEVRAAERRAASYAEQAHAAQLRALRYQINPHFLFNTLNSLSALVLGARTGEAERMIMNLSAFLRTSLTAGSTEDVPLAEELKLQRLYLEIERVRFPDRLRLALDVPIALADACVPALLLQPLVENAIKHGVARTGAPVTLAVTAWAEGGTLMLRVADDAAAPPPEPGAPRRSGGGIGVANVAARLATRFGDAARIESGPRSDGPGWSALIRLPLIRHGR